MLYRYLVYLRIILFRIDLWNLMFNRDLNDMYLSIDKIYIILKIFDNLFL